jgi:hypothetical protein
MEMDMKIEVNMKMDIDMDEDMETWTRTWKHGQGNGNMDEDMGKLWIFTKKSNGKRKPKWFSLICLRKFVTCPFVDEEINGSYPYANGLNGPNGIAHLRKKVSVNY